MSETIAQILPMNYNNAFVTGWNAHAVAWEDEGVMFNFS